VGAKAASVMIKDGKMPFTAGPLAEWTEARDLPTPTGESFRSWFKKRNQG